MQISRVEGGAWVLPEVCARGRHERRDGGPGSRALGRMWIAAARPTGRSERTGQCQDAERVTGTIRARTTSGRPRGGTCGVRGRAGEQSFLGSGLGGRGVVRTGA